MFMITKTNRYLDPTNDVSFRKLFGTEEHKPLLISFLNSILALEGGRKIKQVEFLPKSQAPLIKETKTSILDIKCTDERNMQYIVEMQNKKVPTFVKRTQFYVAHSYVTQLPSGSGYVELKPVILLAIANHELFPGKEGVVSYHKTLDVDTLEHDLEDMSYVFIELPKFNKSENELETLRDKWLYFFKNWEISGEVPAGIKEEEILEAYRSMEEYNWSLEEREAYIKANIALVDEYNARKKEREEGLQEGLQKGREEGREEGEKKRALEIARLLLQQGLMLEQVSKATGISMENLDDMPQ